MKKHWTMSQNTSEINPIGRCSASPLGNENNPRVDRSDPKHFLHLLNSRISAMEDIPGCLLIILRVTFGLVFSLNGSACREGARNKRLKDSLDLGGRMDFCIPTPFIPSLSGKRIIRSLKRFINCNRFLLSGILNHFRDRWGVG